MRSLSESLAVINSAVLIYLSVNKTFTQEFSDFSLSGNTQDGYTASVFQTSIKGDNLEYVLDAIASSAVRCITSYEWCRTNSITINDSAGHAGHPDSTIRYASNVAIELCRKNWMKLQLHPISFAQWDESWFTSNYSQANIYLYVNSHTGQVIDYCNDFIDAISLRKSNLINCFVGGKIIPYYKSHHSVPCILVRVLVESFPNGNGSAQYQVTLTAFK